ncbi:MAG: hypothetical protein LUF35_12885 [Lachnospiraceae bacterium]|nr:hypothetical protein [Lachnospiraceae bacterium]
MSDSTETKNEKKQQKRNFYINLLIIIAILLFITFRSGNTTANTYKITETTFTVIAPDDTQYSLNFADVLHLELVSNADYGTCTQGEDSGTQYYGTWENDAWGTYYLSVSTSVSQCIVIQTADTTIVTNYESNSTTSAFYKELQAYVDL